MTTDPSFRRTHYATSNLNKPTLANNMSPSRKYNTLTAADAKFVRQHMTSSSNIRHPMRTASVLHKPRVPQSLTTSVDAATEIKIEKVGYDTVDRFSVRSASVCGRNANLDTRSLRGSSSNYSHNNRMPKCDTRTNLQPEIYDRSTATSPIDNDSFHSSFDVVGSCTLAPSKFRQAANSPLYSSIHYSSSSHNSPNKMTEDSDKSGSSRYYTPAKACNKPNLKTQFLQSGLSSLKNLFKFPAFNLTKQTTTTELSNSSQTLNASKINSSSKETKINIQDELKRKPPTSFNDSLANSNSLSPTSIPCLQELKSLSYLENTFLSNYSNYDEFTLNRNNKTLSMLAEKRELFPEKREKDNSATSTNHNSANNFLTSDRFIDKTKIGDKQLNNHWLMTSLPVTLDSNLTTVSEEQNATLDETINFIEPPPQYADTTKFSVTSPAALSKPVSITNCVPKNLIQSDSSSSQSFSSITTEDSALECRKKPTAYRFSYGQELDIQQVSFTLSPLFILFLLLLSINVQKTNPCLTTETPYKQPKLPKCRDEEFDAFLKRYKAVQVDDSEISLNDKVLLHLKFYRELGSGITEPDKVPPALKDVDRIEIDNTRKTIIKKLSIHLSWPAEINAVC